jgi:protocatechuate 3,4-dioxygenase beta subunit
MKRTSIVLAAAMVAVMVIPLNTTGQNAKQDAKKVQGAGCVEAGVEAGCLVVKDLRSGKVYNILVKDPRPHVGEGIEFAGTIFDGVTMCMQGTAVEVTSWEHKDTLKCGTGEKKKK